MGSTTPIHALRYPAGGDTPAVPADMGNLALDVDAQLPYVGTSTPTKKPGLVWYNPTTGVLKITDGSTWYTINGQDTGWVSITLLPGFTTGGPAPAARMIDTLIVLRGSVINSSPPWGSGFANWGTLPGGISLPPQTQTFAAAVKGSATATAGMVRVSSGSSSLSAAMAGGTAAQDTIWLDGIAYRTT